MRISLKIVQWLDSARRFKLKSLFMLWHRSGVGIMWSSLQLAKLFCGRCHGNAVEFVAVSSAHIVKRKRVAMDTDRRRHLTPRWAHHKFVWRGVSVFWDVSACCQVEVYRRFRGACRRLFHQAKFNECEEQNVCFTRHKAKTAYNYDVSL